MGKKFACLVAALTFVLFALYINDTLFRSIRPEPEVFLSAQVMHSNHHPKLSDEFRDEDWKNFDDSSLIDVGSSSEHFQKASGGDVLTNKIKENGFFAALEEDSIFEETYSRKNIDANAAHVQTQFPSITSLPADETSNDSSSDDFAMSESEDAVGTATGDREKYPDRTDDQHVLKWERNDEEPQSQSVAESNNHTQGPNGKDDSSFELSVDDKGENSSPKTLPLAKLTVIANASLSGNETVISLTTVNENTKNTSTVHGGEINYTNEIPTIPNGQAETTISDDTTASRKNSSTNAATTGVAWSATTVPNSNQIMNSAETSEVSILQTSNNKTGVDGKPPNIPLHTTREDVRLRDKNEESKGIPLHEVELTSTEQTPPREKSDTEQTAAVNDTVRYWK